MKSMASDRKLLVGTIAVVALIAVGAGAGLVMAHEEDTGEEGDTGEYCHDYDHEDHHRGGGHHHGEGYSWSFRGMIRRLFSQH